MSYFSETSSHTHNDISTVGTSERSVLLQILDKDNSHTLTSEPALRKTWRARLWKRVDDQLISGFHPAYFASVMGCGMSSNLMYGFPFPARWLEIVSHIMAVVALLLFVVLNLLFAAAMCRTPSLFTRIHCDRTFAPFMGCYVMGYITLVTYLHSLLDKSWIVGVYVLWWIATVGSFYTAFITFFLSTMGKRKNGEKRMDPMNLTLAYLLPVVTLTVSASTGGVISPDLPGTNPKVVTMITCFIMWAIAVVLGFIIVSVNFWRLFVHKVPVTGHVFTMFLPIGYLGQGAYAIMLFGRNCATLLLEHSDSSVAASSYTSFLHQTAAANNVDLSGLNLILATSIVAACAMSALLLMAFGYFFTFLAFASALSKMAPFARHPNQAHVYSTTSKTWWRKQLVGMPRFHRAFWSMTFPIGTIALANKELYLLVAGLAFFRYLSAIYAATSIFITLGCLLGVVYHSIHMVLASRRPELTKNIV